MAKQVTVTVPENLHSRMMERKNELNFSGEFQTCISKRLDSMDRYESQLKGGDEMEAIIERLRAEKEKSTDKLFDNGKTEGVIFAKTASYEQLVWLAKWDVETYPDDIRGREALDMWIEIDELLNLWNLNWGYGLGFDEQENFSDHTMIFLLGWQEGISDFWDEVKDKL